MFSMRAIQDVVSEVGRVDVLFNCAGCVNHGTILECTEKDWDLSFDINVKSIYRTCRAVLPGMLNAGKGNIIDISSGASSIQAAPNRFIRNQMDVEFYDRPDSHHRWWVGTINTRRKMTWIDQALRRRLRK